MDFCDRILLKRKLPWESIGEGYKMCYTCNPVVANLRELKIYIMY